MQYKRLIAIPTCWKYEYFDGGDGEHKSGYNDRRQKAVAMTWGGDWWRNYREHIDLYHFLGRNPIPTELPPVGHWIALDVPDDYYNLTFKTRGVVRWALAHGYDYLCKADDDTYVFLDRFLARFDPSIDYRGSVREADGVNYASGACYTLSRRAMEFVAEATPESGEWREDLWVGKTLLKSGILPVHDPSLRMCDCDECDKKEPVGQVTAIHFYNSHIERMYQLHEKCSLTAQT